MQTCSNCTATLDSSFHYCPNCGQSAHIHRFNLPHIFHEVFHALTHADKGVLYLIKSLATHPGAVAREYILQGKRKRYFNPFTFLVLVLGFTIVMNSIFHPYTSSDQRPTISKNSIQNPPSVQAKPQNPKRERQREIQRFLEKRANIVAFAAIPILALIFWLCFIRSGIAYAEHLVACVFFLGFCFLVTALVFTPLIPVFPSGRWHSSAQLLLQFVYVSFGYYQFLGPRKPLLFLKTSFVTLLAIGFWVVFSGTLVYLFIVYG